MWFPCFSSRLSLGQDKKFNEFLRELNIENGLNSYNLNKTTMRKVKGKGIKVVQTAHQVPCIQNIRNKKNNLSVPV